MTAPLGLTRQQRLLLDFLRDREAQDLAAPSLDEMAAALGLKAKSGALRIVQALEERGYVVRKVARVRSVRLIHHRSHPVAQQLRDALIHRLADLPPETPLSPIEVMRLIRETPLDEAPAPGDAPMGDGGKAVA
jgi:repressor LexA